MDHDLLPPSALSGVDLPAETLALLQTTGVPKDVWLPDWLGPSLFSSDLGDGRLFSTTDPGARVARPAAAYLLGTVRDASGPSVYAAFALERGSGAVWLLDLTDPAADRFVNSSLAVFLTAIRAFCLAWPKMTDDEGDARRHVVGFRTLLAHLDPPALADPDHYWPGWLEELE